MPIANIEMIFSYIDTKLFYILFQIITSIFIISLIREMMNIFISFLMFKSNKYVCIGRKVIVNGFKGYITHIGFQFIIVRNEKKTYLIQTTRWRYEKWEFEEVGD
jgi:hypothetical protein